jgi:hypothetical protein
MRDSGMIFLEFNLPNATTWFYFSVLLAIALFFKFTRIFSIRNWDVLALFALVPGLLLLLESRTNWFGYLWLILSSAYFLTRCLVDLALVRRPALTANLNLAGLIWLAGALFVSLVAVSIRQPGTAPENAAAEPAPVSTAQKKAENLAEGLANQNGWREGEDGRPGVRFWVGRALTVLCHLSVVLGLIFVAWRHFHDVHAGMAAATFYLLLPYPFLLLPFTNLQVGQWHHVWPMALIVWAVVAYRRPTIAGLLLGLAAGTVFFPIVLLPVWLSFYGRQGAGRCAGACVLSFAVIALLLWSDGELTASLQYALSLSNWQPWKAPDPNTPGFWTGFPWAYRLPVFIGYMAFVLTTAFWPQPKNLGHLLALSAAVLIGIQFWYADQGGVYVFWYLPLVLLLVFRPNLVDRLAPVIHRESDWLRRLGRWLLRLSIWLLRLPHPPVQVG